MAQTRSEEKARDTLKISTAQMAHRGAQRGLRHTYGRGRGQNFRGEGLQTAHSLTSHKMKIFKIEFYLALALSRGAFCIPVAGSRGHGSERARVLPMYPGRKYALSD